MGNSFTFDLISVFNHRLFRAEVLPEIEKLFKSEGHVERSGTPVAGRLYHRGSHPEDDVFSEEGAQSKRYIRSQDNLFNLC